MHTVLLLLATLPSFCTCQSQIFLEESAAVTEFIQSMAGPLPINTVNYFCQPDSRQLITWKGVEYACEMDTEGRVTKLAAVGNVENHRYQRDFGYFSILRNILGHRPRPAFDVLALRKLPSLTYLYPIIFTKALSECWF